MTKRVSGKGQGKDCATRVAEWLGKQGFPLEARVTREFEQAGFEVVPHHYVDTGASAPREIDLLAVRDHPVMGASIKFVLFVECKWSQDAPWVLYALASDRPEPASLYDATIADPMGEAVLWLLDDPLKDAATPFGSPAPKAYGGCRAFKQSDPDQIYAALQSVASIARAGIGWQDRRRAMPSLKEDASFAFPVIVIDAPLFLAGLDASKELRIRKITRARVRWLGAQLGEVAHIEIVTAEALQSYLSECRGGMDSIYDFLMIAHRDLREARRMKSLDPIRARLHGRRIGRPIEWPHALRGLLERWQGEQQR